VDGILANSCLAWHYVEIMDVLETEYMAPETSLVPERRLPCHIVKGRYSG